MANLLPNERVINRKASLASSLEYLREPLRKIERSYKPGSLFHDGAADSPDSGPQKAISRLLSVLLGHEVALTFAPRLKTAT